MIVRRAAPDLAKDLTSIAIRSKGYWGHTEAWLNRWGRDLHLTPAYILSNEVHVCEVEGAITGFYALLHKSPVAILDHLWVRPTWIGRGCGRLLFEHAAHLASTLGALAMDWVADPNAAGFYERMGGRSIRRIQSEMERSLSVMRIDLENPSQAHSSRQRQQAS